ncbi:hypothetical protein B566_EDAN001847 [Ephemera danica]|nr:hypothetical protein B566_EDAN001847 [Ephemera danica]
MATPHMGNANCKERSPVSNLTEDDFVESVVCQESELAENEMKEVLLLGDQKVLLVKQGGTITAMGTKCTHYGAPLVKGALGNGRVRCPWHGACFNIKTGDIEDFPGLDSVPCYEVKVEPGGQVRVRARRSDLTANKRVRGMARRDPNNNKTAIVVGGGGSGASCVETLRQEGFTGRVVFVCKEPHLPYDRPNKGEPLKYDALFLATGSDPREVKDYPGGELKNIVTLRTTTHANFISAECKGKRAVVIGNSFIGMEAAAFLSDKASSVTVVGRSQVPFEAVLGREVGGRLQQLFTEHKVTVLGGRSLEKFTPSESDTSKVGAVVLTDGTVLPADLCVIGLGTIPATQYLDGTPVKLDSRTKTVVVDKHLSSSVPGIWAGGDIAATPLRLNDEDLKDIAIGHWQIAHYHGKVAGINMVATIKHRPEKSKELKTVPFFWTMIFGKGVRYAGYGAGFDDVKIIGDLADYKFAAYYLKKGKVVAIATMGKDPLAAQFAERLASQLPPLTKEMLEQDPEGWTKNP